MANETPSVDTIFCAAIAIAPDQERASYISKACGADQKLRGRVEKLVAAHFQAGNFLEVMSSAVATIDTPMLEGPGTVIGPYKLLQQIGEGGMGIVFMAERSDPVRQTVALKIIRPGMDSRQVIARFEAERQALAMMDHPNIAKVFDAGTVGPVCRTGPDVSPADAPGPARQAGPTGRPYFVMELVQGVAITKYCDDNQLTLRERLELFIPVCQAVMHAHQKGIIHRDLKPSNVLVARYDDKPVPKVIDFGVAKATGQKLTERTLFTQFGQLVGTLEYMSPEQATLNALDIDTRSDIYSLGVLLYELLTGSTPFEKKRLKETAFDEVLRIIREEEPPTPSKRLSRSRLPSGTSAPRDAVSPIGEHSKAAASPGPARQAGPTLETIAGQRKVEPAKLARLVRGDLDWIVMKALDKDRNRRYETASAFGEDIRRYLADEPVLAGPPTAGYRLRKFARRHRGAILTAIALTTALAILAGGIGWVIHDREGRRAETTRQVQDALTAARTLTEVNQPVLARQKLAEARGLIGNDRAALAGLGAEVDSFEAELDRLRKFMGLVDQAYERELTPSPPPVPGAKQRWAGDFILEALDCYKLFERADWLTTLEHSDLGKSQVEQVRRAVYEQLLRMANYVAEHEFWDDARWGKLSPGPNFEIQARRALVFLEAAETTRPPTVAFFRIRAIRHKALKQDDAARADEELVRRTAPTMGIDCYLAGRAASSNRNYAEAVKAYDGGLRLEPTHFWSMMQLGNRFSFLGLSKGPEYFKTAVRIFDGCILNRPDNALAHKLRGDGCLALHRYQEAVEDYSKAIDLNPKDLFTWMNRASAHAGLQQPDQAIADYSQAIALRPYGRTLNTRAQFYVSLGRWDEALADFAEVIDKTLQMPRPYISYDPTALNGLALAYSELGQWEKAIAHFTRILDRYPDLPKALDKRGEFYGKLGKWDEARADHAKAINIVGKFPGQLGSWSELFSNRGRAYANLGQKDKALADYAKVLEVLDKDTRGLNDLAWRLTTDEDAKFRNSRLAVELAKKAVEMAPKEGSYWNTLGIAHYRAGDWQASLAAMSKAMELSNGGSGWDWFFVAMAKWQLDRKDEAKKDYSRAVQWMNTNEPNNGELRRFRAEAAKLLGVKESSSIQPQRGAMVKPRATP